MDRVRARQCGNPLSESARGREASPSWRAPVEIRIIEIPAAQLFARSRLPTHRTQRLEQTVIAQSHQHRNIFLQLFIMQTAVKRDVAVLEFLQKRVLAWRVEQRLP